MKFDVKKIYGDRGKRVVEYMELVVEQIERDYNAANNILQEGLRLVG